MDFQQGGGKYTGRCCEACDADIEAVDAIRYDEESSRVIHDHCWRSMQRYSAEKLVIAAQIARASGSTATAYEAIMIQARHHASEAVTR